MVAKDIHKENLSMYSEHCLPRQAIHNWVQKFSEGLPDDNAVERAVCAWFQQQLQEF
jgi:hypothetical protein